MSKKKDRQTRSLKIKDAGSLGNLNLSEMKIKDLKRACVAKGMPFEEVVQSSVLQLESWYLRNHANKNQVSLLDQFDAWFETHLRDECGTDETFLHPMLRLGYIAEENNNGEIKKRRIKGYKKERQKRVKNELGIYSGTKKALTFECAKKGISKEETIRTVMGTFEDAKAKSIGIWYNKALKAN